MKLQKIFFLLLLLFGSLTGVYFSVRSAGALYEYASLEETAEARISRWEIKEIKGKFPLKAFYSFETKGKIWDGSSRLGEPWHLNEGSAVAELREKAKKTWVVWFNPKDPSKSSLERSLPVALLIRTLVCYAVILYFIVFFRKKILN